MKSVIAFAVLSLLAATPAFSQVMGTTQFRRLALASDTFEIASGRLVANRSRNLHVRSFALRMINDHTLSTAAIMGGAPPALGSGAALLGLAAIGPIGLATGGALGSIASDTRLAPHQIAALDQLAALEGRAFDRVYVESQIAAHREAIAFYTAYVQTGSDPSFVNFAQQTLPFLEMHLAEAQRLWTFVR